MTAYVPPSIAETDPAYVEDVILLAYPNGIAMIGLGYPLWSTARGDVPMQPAEVRDRRATTTGGEATV